MAERRSCSIFRILWNGCGRIQPDKIVEISLFNYFFFTRKVESDWGLEDQFVVNQVQVALGVDSVESTEALFHEVNTPDEIANRFSSISYNKGGSVIRMFEHTFGRDNFIKAHHHYLETK